MSASGITNLLVHRCLHASPVEPTTTTGTREYPKTGAPPWGGPLPLLGGRNHKTIGQGGIVTKDCVVCAHKSATGYDPECIARGGPGELCASFGTENWGASRNTALPLADVSFVQRERPSTAGTATHLGRARNRHVRANGIKSARAGSVPRTRMNQPSEPQDG